MGATKGEGVLGWSNEEKAYKYQGFDSMGMMMAATGKNEGNTWTWTGQDKMGGKLIHSPRSASPGRSRPRRPTLMPPCRNTARGPAP